MLITDEYRKQQSQLHEQGGYGKASLKFAPIVERVAQRYGFTELLDYGSGKGNLSKALGNVYKVTNYDPAIEQFAAYPSPHDMVACIDVLEHIEPDLLDNVLDDLQRLTLSVGVFTINCAKAGKVLPDGRNAHLIVQPQSWWMPQIQKRFTVKETGKLPKGFYVVCEPL